MKLTITDQRSSGVRQLANLAAGAIAFAVIVLAVLLFIVFDLAPRTGLYPGREYEAIRIAVELLALLGSGGLISWVLFSDWLRK